MAEDTWSRVERETVVTTNDADDFYMIWTARKPFMRRIRQDDRFTIVDETEDFVDARISKEHYTEWGGLKRRMSAESREKAAERMREMQASGKM